MLLVRLLFKFCTPEKSGLGSLTECGPVHTITSKALTEVSVIANCSFGFLDQVSVIRIISCELLHASSAVEQ